MNTRMRIAESVLCVMLLFLAAACGRGGGVSEPAPAGPGAIRITGVQVASGEALIVRGESRLPDGACIQVRLYADQSLQSWWPADLCGTVEEGVWEISVPLVSADYSIELSPEVIYQVIANQEGVPGVESQIFVFDLAPPGE